MNETFWDGDKCIACGVPANYLCTICGFLYHILPRLIAGVHPSLLREMGEW